MTPPLPSKAAPRKPVADPAWWRLGAIPFLVLIIAAAWADTGFFCSQIGLGAGVSCLLLTLAVLLLRKDFSIGEQLFLGGLALVNATALMVRGNVLCFFLGIIVPFVIQFFPRKPAYDKDSPYRTWWGFWLLHRKKDADGKKEGLGARLRAVMPLLVCILVGVIIFIVFLTIFAQGNPVVEAVWNAIVDAWNKLVAYLHISWDIFLHALVWINGIAIFGIYTLRHPYAMPEAQAPNEAPAKPKEEEEAKGSTILPHLPICALLGVDLAFLVATSTDIFYLWSGTVPEGVNQTAYLHDGALSITWASILAAVMLIFFFRRNGSARRSISCKVAGYLLLLQTFLLAVSVYMRLYYQINDFGFTRMRVMASEAMLMGLAGLVVLFFYMACSGSFFKYAKICMGVMLLMLVSYGICSPSRVAGDLNMAYHDTHPQWKFSQKDFNLGRFDITENLSFAYYVYQQDPENNQSLLPAMRYQALRIVNRANSREKSEDGGWKGWTCIEEIDLPTAMIILSNTKPEEMEECPSCYRR